MKEVIKKPSKLAKDEYPKYAKGVLDDIMKGLPQEEQDQINEMVLNCADTNGENKLLKIKRHLIQLRDVTGKPFNELEKADLKWFFHLLKQGRSAQTVQEIHWQVKKFCSEILDKYGLMKDIKVKHVRGIDEEKYSESNLITQEDVEKMGRFATSYKDKAFLFLSFFTGARPGSILRLTWDRILFEKDFATVKLFATKNSKQRDFPVPAEVKKVLWDWKENYSYPNLNEKKDFVFPSPYNREKPLTTASTNKMLRVLAKRAGLKKDCWNYLLRHSRSQRLYEELPVPVVEKLMAHKDMYRVYSKISNKEAKRQLFEKIYNIEELTEQDKKEITELKEQLGGVLKVTEFFLKKELERVKGSKKDPDRKELESLAKLMSEFTGEEYRVVETKKGND